ncbi:MAG TPA: hypothetical protein VFF21_09540 [Flavobacteriaceae bacterium]|nr:hypothetical protein [Flavobacteriaceae bacterium]
MKEFSNSKEFLRAHLNQIFLETDGITISYEFRSSSNTHLVEVKPKDIYNSEAYMDKEMELEDKFREFFPDEELMFINETSLTQIKSPEFCFQFKFDYELSMIITPMKMKNQSMTREAKENNFALAA